MGFWVLVLKQPRADFWKCSPCEFWALYEKQLKASGYEPPMTLEELHNMKFEIEEKVKQKKANKEGK